MRYEPRPRSKRMRSGADFCRRAPARARTKARGSRAKSESSARPRARPLVGAHPEGERTGKMRDAKFDATSGARSNAKNGRENRRGERRTGRNDPSAHKWYHQIRCWEGCIVDPGRARGRGGGSAPGRRGVLIRPAEPRARARARASPPPDPGAHPTGAATRSRAVPTGERHSSSVLTCQACIPARASFRATSWQLSREVADPAGPRSHLLSF